MDKGEYSFYVRGVVFPVSVEIIKKSKYLSELITDKSKEYAKVNNFRIDRSPKLFEHVLNYLTDDNYPFKRKYKSELDFYQIEYDESKLYPPNDKKEVNNKASNGKRFTFNLRGKKFTTTHDTIQKSEYLKALVSGKFSPPDEDGSYFIDRDSKLFREVLKFITMKDYLFEKKYKDELDFYAIEYSDNQLHDNNQILINIQKYLNAGFCKLLDVEIANNELLKELIKISTEKGTIDREKLNIEKKEKKLCLYDGCIMHVVKELEYSKIIFYYYCNKHIKENKKAYYVQFTE